MRILAFDTATRATAVALDDGERTVERSDMPAPGERPGHATELLPLVAELMDDAGITWEQIDRLAVGLGPGTFTGLRIGVATAKALARASGTPVVGVSTLQSLALNARLIAEPAAHDVAVGVLDARRGEVYAGAWSLDALHGQALLPPQALVPSALPRVLRELGSDFVAVGDGAIAFREVLERAGMSIPGDDSVLHRVTAVSHCVLASRLPVSDPEALAPDYQRLPDAQPRSTGPDRSRES